MNDRGIIICVGIAFLIFIFLWVYFKNKKVKTGNYGNYSYYDKLTDRLDAKLGHDSSFHDSTLFRSRKLSFVWKSTNSFSTV